MATLNSISSAVFDVLLAPFGHGPAWFDLLLWPVLGGVIALVVYKYASNQQGIERAKARIRVHLYEIRLFRHDPLVVLGSTGKILLRNALYLGHNLLPMAVMLVPMLAVLTQLEANYAFAPSAVGTVELLHGEAGSEAGGLSSRAPPRAACRVWRSTPPRSAPRTARPSGACAPRRRATTCCRST